MNKLLILLAALMIMAGCQWDGPYVEPKSESKSPAIEATELMDIVSSGDRLEFEEYAFTYGFIRIKRTWPMLDYFLATTMYNWQCLSWSRSDGFEYLPAEVKQELEPDLKRHALSLGDRLPLAFRAWAESKTKEGCE